MRKYSSCGLKILLVNVPQCGFIPWCGFVWIICDRRKFLVCSDVWNMSDVYGRLMSEREEKRQKLNASVEEPTNKRLKQEGADVCDEFVFIKWVPGIVFAAENPIILIQPKGYDYLLNVRSTFSILETFVWELGIWLFIKGENCLLYQGIHLFFLRNQGGCENWMKLVEERLRLQKPMMSTNGSSFSGSTLSKDAVRSNFYMKFAKSVIGRKAMRRWEIMNFSNSCFAKVHSEISISFC